MNNGTPLQYRHYTGLSADRLYRMLYRHVTRYSGYQPFGLDWPTLLMCHPHIGRVMSDIDQLYRSAADGEIREDNR